MPTTQWMMTLEDHIKFIFGKKYYQQAVSLYHEYEHCGLFPKCDPIDGARQFLLYLVQSAIPHAIVTNGKIKEIKKDIEQLGWEDLVATTPIITSDQVLNKKPDADHAIYAIKSLGVDPYYCPMKIFIIGDDQKTDLLCARHLKKKVHKDSEVIIYLFGDDCVENDEKEIKLIVENNFKRIVAGIENDGVYGSNQINSFRFFNQTEKINEHMDEVKSIQYENERGYSQ
ncbi:MAG: HAD hydrolase-like protein [Gammaproteobacteria bacterium]|nr:HAD hydrolase-like protein [Gammaproteobacteria bacterium]